MTKCHENITMIGSRRALQGVSEEEEMYFISLKANYLVVFSLRFYKNTLYKIYIAGYLMI